MPAGGHAQRQIRFNPVLSGLNCAFGTKSLTVAAVRDRETIDSELRLLAAVRRSMREHGGEPSSRQVDKLLDERNELTSS
jgi:hypothetical protein